MSAASICAKVIRDLALKNWNFLESIKINEENGWGSGYPNGNYFINFITFHSGRFKKKGLWFSYLIQKVVSPPPLEKQMFCLFDQY